MNTSEKSILTRRRVPFSKKEDNVLIQLVKQFGESNWDTISKFMKNRTIRQCRERWQNSLSPKNLKRDWTREEDQLILQKYNIFGPHWKSIESFFNGRTSYSIRNRFKSLIKKESEKFNTPIEKDGIQKEINNETLNNCDNINYTDLLTFDYSDDYSFGLQNNIDFDVYPFTQC